MSSFFIVKGELAAWALGLDQDDIVPAEDTAALRATELPAAPVNRRRWRRGHESYRALTTRRQTAELWGRRPATYGYLP